MLTVFRKGMSYQYVIYKYVHVG